MTTFLLIRHAAHVLGGGVIAGRSDAATLSPLGVEQADALAGRLAHLRVDAAYTSPVLRCRQTAGVVCERWGVTPTVSDPLAEVDFGDFAGRSLDDLRPRDDWRRWNAFRSGARCPGGERMTDVQHRAVGEVMRLSDAHGAHGGATVALFSHADVIKATLAHFLGLPLDLFLRLEVSLASTSVLAIADGGPWVQCVNATGRIDLPWPP